MATELPSGTVKVMLIGVELDHPGRRAMEALKRAGGDMVTFKDARNLQEVESCFTDIAVSIKRTVIPMPAQTPSDPSEIPFDPSAPIQKKSRVRYEGTASLAGGRVSYGDIGVVQKRFANNKFQVTFCGRTGVPTCHLNIAASDLAPDADAEKVRTGSLVRVKKSRVATPSFGVGAYREGMVGYVVRQDENDGESLCEFGLGKLWKGTLTDLELVEPDTNTSRPLQVGDAVQAINASFGCGPVNMYDLGYICERKLDGNLRANFPGKNKWTGRPTDFVLDTVATQIGPQTRVRIRNGVKNLPGGPPRGSVGVVKNIMYDASKVTVDYGGREFTCRLADLEPVGGTNQATPTNTPRTTPPSSRPQSSTPPTPRASREASASSSSSPFSVGDIVETHGTSKAIYNNRTGRIEGKDTSSGRFLVVFIDDKSTLPPRGLFNAENLKRVEADIVD
uniref:Uncharacterized protein n=1 Tax=Chromera velia CCMP2878 TaxID=1169474 RepID=A0A0G4FMV9_9ALVE|eukprot:Cvel_17718.t1-p1 / transcript=Cvel_17718.t1 / gene=Cvel_17718 / organism=Chromera_velia_CCMP2878 / gene_product=hypothetical protein / transcript_product=hypothetical protein / location=Cvel_scaffold1430:36719-38988(+) / protein_length=449 / sequence_SO=supercontig / SO=protein_coding / is_pseudo=false